MHIPIAYDQKSHALKIEKQRWPLQSRLRLMVSQKATKPPILARPRATQLAWVPIKQQHVTSRKIFGLI
jgi:hypothetical protein